MNPRPPLDTGGGRPTGPTELQMARKVIEKSGVLPVLTLFIETGVERPRTLTLKAFLVAAHLNALHRHHQGHLVGDLPGAERTHSRASRFAGCDGEPAQAYDRLERMFVSLCRVVEHLAAQFSIPSTASDGTTSGPARIIVGPDRNLWFTENQANKIGKITPQGIITEYPVPTANSYPNDIAVGTDGNLWFTESQGPKIREISTDGRFKEFVVPSGDDDPEGITFDQAGNLWFTAFRGNRIVEATIR